MAPEIFVTEHGTKQFVIEDDIFVIEFDAKIFVIEHGTENFVIEHATKVFCYLTWHQTICC